jgi:DNA-binding transcriptional regulator LsrR (DeoR family)
VDTIARVRRAFYVQGWSLKQISRELHVSRNTVRRLLQSGELSFVEAQIDASVCARRNPN